MLVRRAPKSSAWCSNCRFTLIKAFISSSGLLVRPTAPARRNRVQNPSPDLSAGFATSREWRSNAIQQHSLQSLVAEGKDALDVQESTVEEDEPPGTGNVTPWYLQVETPQRLPNPLLERQQLPPLPPDPPPLLGPILEHISIDLGLDDLALLDLREIDPPPALGAKLIMVIGTARGEKHLHVSADRFCRWLKVTHKLSPYADGLLGRGELKLKLRRKARRAKLLSNVGASETRPVDDGIRTGWICVNVGTIEDGKDVVESYNESEGYVGFGSEATGAKVVIQMLTQEKREELDLEDLWGKVISRHERKDGRDKNDQPSMTGYGELRQDSRLDERLGSDHQISPFHRSSNRPMMNVNRGKQFHRQYSSSNDVRDASHISNSDTIISGKQTRQSDGNLKVLRSHIVFLKSLSPDLAIKALGNDLFDQHSTSFLYKFFKVLPSPASAAHRECLWDLVAYGISIRHPGYSRGRLLTLFDRVERYHSLEQRDFMRIAEMLFDPNRGSHDPPSLTRRCLCDALVHLTHMYSHGYDIQSTEIRGMMQRAVRYVFGERGKIGPNDPDRLKLSMESFQARARESSGYPVCLRMVIDCLEEMQNEEGYWDISHEENDGQIRKILV